MSILNLLPLQLSVEFFIFIFWQVSSALYCLRQRNTYQGSISLNWPRPVANFGDSGGIVSTFDCYTNQTQEPGSHINEIIESSKIKARTMVDAAVQVHRNLAITSKYTCLMHMLP